METNKKGNQRETKGKPKGGQKESKEKEKREAHQKNSSIQRYANSFVITNTAATSSKVVPLDRPGPGSLVMGEFSRPRRREAKCTHKDTKYSLPRRHA
jgi:hypothetical protein